MSELEVLENVGSNAVHRLRTETLSAGQPFMINVADLPKDQCYLEYPDHSIHLMSYIKGKNDFVSLKKLSSKDGASLRKRLGLV